MDTQHYGITERINNGMTYNIHYNTVLYFKVAIKTYIVVRCCDGQLSQLRIY